MRAALATVLVLALAGCGGEDSLSRAEWAGQANEICLETLKQVEALGEPATSADYLRVTPAANELGRDAIERLRELDPPGEIATDAREMIEGYEESIRQQELVYEAMKAQGEGGGQLPDYGRAGMRAIEAGRAADAIAERLRATDCARDPWQSPSQT
jgi:hypothetical protein